jgi:hypothetical protein
MSRKSGRDGLFGNIPGYGGPLALSAAPPEVPRRTKILGAPQAGAAVLQESYEGRRHAAASWPAMTVTRGKHGYWPPNKSAAFRRRYRLKKRLMR